MIPTRMRFRSTIAAAAGLSLVFGLAACGDSANGDTVEGLGLEERDSENLPDDWEEVVQAAIEEGEVILYTNQSQEVSTATLEAFNEAYPQIEVRAIRDSVDTLPNRFVQEYNSTDESPADLLESSIFEPVIADNPDWFVNIREMDPGEVPTLQAFPLDQAAPPHRPRSITSAAYTWTLAYNTDRVSEDELPETWEDITDPKWKDRMIVADPRSASAYFAFHALMFENYGPAFGEGIVANNATLSESGASLSQQVSAGAFDIGGPVARSHSAQIRSQGAPVEHLDLLPAKVSATTMAMPVDPPNPNARRVLATFLLSAQAQEIQCTIGQLGSLNSRAAGDCDDFNIDPSLEVFDLTIPDDVQAPILDAMNLN